jgi:endonuclease III
MTVGFKPLSPVARLSLIDAGSRPGTGDEGGGAEAMKTRKSGKVKSTDPKRLCEIERRLRAAYGQPRHYNPSDPLDDLVFLVLSRMTQEVKYLRTYQAVRREMPTWGVVMDAPVDDLEELLQDAGLAPTKSRQIQAILKEIEARERVLDLSRLRGLSDDEVEAYLASLPGVARKTARCVMLYALDRQACPVDTHVWRIMRRLGVAPDKPWSESDARSLEEAIPKNLRSSLHVTLIAHGRTICRARYPICRECALLTLCPSADRVPSRGDAGRS